MGVCHPSIPSGKLWKLGRDDKERWKHLGGHPEYVLEDEFLLPSLHPLAYSQDVSRHAELGDQGLAGEDLPHLQDPAHQGG